MLFSKWIHCVSFMLWPESACSNSSVVSSRRLSAHAGTSLPSMIVAVTNCAPASSAFAERNCPCSRAFLMR